MRRLVVLRNWTDSPARGLRLLAKPSSCQGCSAYNNSQHWVPDVYVAGSQVLVLQGEVSEYDVKGQQVIERTGTGKYGTLEGAIQPFQGPDGLDIIRASKSYSRLAGLTPDDVSLGSCVRCHTGFAGKAQQEAATYCQATHFHPPQSIELVVALGPVAAQAMGLEGKIEQWRGHVL